MDTDKKVLSYKEVSEMTGVNINTLYSFVRKKQIPHQRISKRLVKFEREEIRSWWKAKKVPLTENG